MLDSFESFCKRLFLSFFLVLVFYFQSLISYWMYIYFQSFWVSEFNINIWIYSIWWPIYINSHTTEHLIHLYYVSTGSCIVYLFQICYLWHYFRMCLFVCVYTHTHTHAHIEICLYLYLYTYKYSDADMSICLSVYTNIVLRVYIHI